MPRNEEVRMRMTVVLFLTLGMSVASEARMEVHTVRRGDTLDSIRTRFAPSVVEITEANGSGFDPIQIREGQEIRIPVDSYIEVRHLTTERDRLRTFNAAFKRRTALLAKKLEKYRVYAEKSGMRAKALEYSVMWQKAIGVLASILAVLLCVSVAMVVSLRRRIVRLSKAKMDTEEELRVLKAKDRQDAAASQSVAIGAARTARETLITMVEKLPAGMTRDDIVHAMRASMPGTVTALTRRHARRN